MAERIEIDITDELANMARTAQREGLRLDAYEAIALMRARQEIVELRQQTKAMAEAWPGTKSLVGLVDALANGKTFFVLDGYKGKTFEDRGEAIRYAVKVWHELFGSKPTNEDKREVNVKEIDAADALDAVLNAMRNAEAKLGWILRVRQGVAELRRLRKENAELRQRAEAAEKERVTVQYVLGSQEPTK